MVSLIGRIRKDLVAQSLSVAVITPYKAQVRRLKQALQPFHDMSVEEDDVSCRGGERIKEKDKDKDKEKERNKIKNDKDNKDKENEKQKIITKKFPKDEIEDGEEDEMAEISGEEEDEVEKEVEKEEVKSFDCEVNSIDGFQVGHFLFLYTRFSFLLDFYYILFCS